MNSKQHQWQELDERECPKCKKQLRYMQEYAHPCPERYDGISEIVYECGHRFGRWTGKELKEGEIEVRLGGGDPYVPDTCECKNLKNPKYPTCFDCYDK